MIWAVKGVFGFPLTMYVRFSFRVQYLTLLCQNILWGVGCNHRGGRRWLGEQAHHSAMVRKTWPLSFLAFCKHKGHNLCYRAPSLWCFEWETFCCLVSSLKHCLGSLGGVTSLQEVCHWWQALKLKAPWPFSLFPAYRGESVSSHLPILAIMPAAMYPHYDGLLSLWNSEPKETLSYV